jgi:V8-like Glu-specific endopeptidase
MRNLRLLAIVALLLATAAPAAAILKGTPDDEHRYVGILVTEIDGERVPVCSGFLVTDTAFVTSAHCIADLGSSPAFVSFDRRFKDSSPVVGGTPVQNPDFTGSMEGDTHDLALVILDAPAKDVGHAELPSAGALGSVRRKDELTVLGYGATGFTRKDGQLVPKFKLVRSVGEVHPFKVKKQATNVRMTSGPCYGDSGGPVLLEDTDTAVAVNSFVTGKRCNRRAFAYRLDTKESLDFLEPYL